MGVIPVKPPSRADEAKRRAAAIMPTKSHSWQQAGLARQLSAKAVKRARVQFALLSPLLAGVLVVYQYRQDIFGTDTPVRIATVVALLAIGWAMARDVGRALGPALFRRLDPGTAGTVGFLIRLGTVVLALLVALRIAGLPPGTLAVGGAFTAVIVGLAAQQTLGNLFAGMILLSARPFRVGDRVQLQGGGLAGSIEGIVSSLGLLYTVLSKGDDEVMVPNSVVLAVAVTPVREPGVVDLRARLRAGVTPAQVEQILVSELETQMKGQPRVTLEELDGDEVVVQIAATPMRDADGAQLASEMLEAVAGQTRPERRPLAA